MTEDIAELKSKQLLAISHIIGSPSLEEACRRAKISKGTLYTWLKTDIFKNELKRQREEVVNDSLATLKSAIARATEELIKLMDIAKPDLRRLVCKDILDYGLKAIEIEKVEARIDELEDRITKNTR
jgi:Na+/phosphate symporter